MAGNIPPPPPGFVLDTSVPAPPPGFQIGTPTQQPAAPAAPPAASTPAPAAQGGQAVNLRRPQPTGPGFTVDVLGRQYVVDAPSQEVADRAAAAVAARMGTITPPDPNVPQVPTGDDPIERANPMTDEEMFDQGAIDMLTRELWTQERADRPFVQKVGDWTRSLLQGATLGAGDEIVAGIDALIPGGMNFNERLAYEQQQLGAFRAENPVGALATEIGGGLPWLASPGALPRSNQSFGTNVARSAGNAAAIGTAYGAFGTNGGLDERAEGAMGGLAMGAGVGAGIPALGRLISPAANVVRATLPNADRSLVRALRESGTDGPGAASILRRNPDLTLADIDPNARTLALGIAAQPGEGRQIINEAVNLRRQTAPDRVANVFDREMGPTPDVYNTLEGMRTTAQTNAQQGFGQALGGAGPVDLSRAVQAIEAQLFPGGVRPQNWRPLTAADAELASVLNRLTQGGTGLITDPQALHAIQSELRETASALGRSATGSERRTASIINRVRQDIVDAIDEAAGGPPAGTAAAGAATGPYRAAQAQYATDMQVREAFDRGFNVLQNPTAGDAAIEARPEFWREWVNGLTPAELDAARLGARAAVDTAVGSARNAASRGIAVPDVEFNYERLALLFGRDEADNIAAELADARLIAQTNEQLVGNSMTELRRQGVEATAVRPVLSGASASGTGVLGIAAGVMAGQGQVLPAIGLGALGAANLGRRYLGNLMDQARNAELARVVMASGPEAQARLGSLVGPMSLRGLMTPNRLVELGLAPARTAVPAVSNY